MGSRRSVYIGSFTKGAGGEGSGISHALQDMESGELSLTGLAAATVSPSFLAWHPDHRHLYAVNENARTAVTAYVADDDGTLTHAGSQPTGGEGACHLVVHPSGRHILSANYGSGSLSVHPLRPDGSLAERTDYVEHSGSGPNAARQESPHVHHVRVDPSGRWVLAVDLGTDTIVSYALDPDRGTLSRSSAARTDPGAGPRHLAFGDELGSTLVHVAGELDSTVTTFGLDENTGTLDKKGVSPSTFSQAPEGNYPSEIASSEDGHFLYVANRGLDVVTTLRVTADGIHPVSDVPTGGSWPRHLAVFGGHLYVANQHSHQVTHFVLDAETGTPVRAGDAIDVPSPACVLPAPSAT